MEKKGICIALGSYGWLDGEAGRVLGPSTFLDPCERGLRCGRGHRHTEY